MCDLIGKYTDGTKHYLLYKMEGVYITYVSMEVNLTDYSEASCDEVQMLTI